MTLLDKRLRTEAVEDFTCPICEQAPGRRCREPKRDWRDRRTLYQYVGPHRERVELAYRAEIWDAWEGGDC